MLAVLLAGLFFTTPSHGIDSLGQCLEDPGSLQNIVAVRLYRANCFGDGQPALVREKSSATAHNESLTVDTTGCMTYFVTSVNAAGKETPIVCAPRISFPRVVSVEHGLFPVQGPKLFDLQSRHMRDARPFEDDDGKRRWRCPTCPSGVYFERHRGKKRIIIIR